MATASTDPPFSSPEEPFPRKPSGSPATTPSPAPRQRGSTVAAATAILMASVLLSRLLGLVRDTIIAHQFGESMSTDAFTAAFKIPDLLSYLIAGGALSSTFIPVLSDYLQRGDEREAWRVFSIMATVTALVSVVFVILTELFAVPLTRVMNPGYHDPARIALAAHLTRIVLPAQIFFMLGGLFIAAQQVRGQYLVPSLSASIYNLGMIFGALALRRLGFSGVMLGALGGALVGSFALQLVFVGRVGVSFRPSLNLRHPGVARIGKLMLPIVLGVSLPNVDQLVNSIFASELPGGAQTALQYAIRMMLIPIGIFGQAVGQAVLPQLSRHASAGNRKELRRSIVTGLRQILFLTLPASALLCILSEPVITMLFQHGQFTQADTARTARALQFYAVGIFAWSAQAILTRAFYAMEDSRLPVLSGTAMTAVFVAMNWFVVRFTSWGVNGLALSTTIAATLHGAVMLYFLDRRLGKIAGHPLAWSTVKSLVGTLLLCAVCVPVSRLLRATLAGFPPLHAAALDVAITGALGVAAFLAMSYAQQMPELQAASGLLRRFSALGRLPLALLGRLRGTTVSGGR